METKPENVKNVLRVKRTVKKTYLYFVLSFVLLLISGYFSWQKFHDLRGVTTRIHNAEESITQVQNISSSLTTEEDSSILDERLALLDTIFPKNEEFHKLTRQLEKYFIDSNTANQRIFLKSVNFATPKVPQVGKDEEADYAILPMTLEIEGSKEKFFEFLKFLENSGSFDSEKKNRLMSLESITFTIPDETKLPSSTETGAPTAIFNMTIHAYFQKKL